MKEMEEGAFWVDSGDDGFDGDFFAVGENDPGDGAVFDEDVLNFGIGADFSANLSCRFGERACEGAKSARGNAAEPTGWASAAARRRRTAVDPADQGPSAVPKMPRAAITARRSSLSKNSATKSATAMGPQRSRSNMPDFPRMRTLRPVLRRLQRSSGVGLSIAGG